MQLEEIEDWKVEIGGNWKEVLLDVNEMMMMTWWRTLLSKTGLHLIFSNTCHIWNHPGYLCIYNMWNIHILFWCDGFLKVRLPLDIESWQCLFIIMFYITYIYTTKHLSLFEFSIELSVSDLLYNMNYRLLLKSICELLWFEIIK